MTLKGNSGLRGGTLARPPDPRPSEPVTAAHPECYLCTWPWDYNFGAFALKFVHRGCRQHGRLLGSSLSTPREPTPIIGSLFSS